MWSGLRNRKKGKNDYSQIFHSYDDSEELNPLISKSHDNADNSDDSENIQHIDNSEIIPTNNIEVEVTSPDDSIKETSVEIDSIDEFIKIKNDVYVSNCIGISCEFVKSIGFNSILSINSGNISSDDDSCMNINITPESIKQRSTHKIIEEYIKKGEKMPKMLINFDDINVMVVVTSYYILKTGMKENVFMEMYPLGDLPREYIGVVNTLIPNIHQFDKENNFEKLHDMFPDVPQEKLEKLYKECHGNMEEIVSSIFS